MAEVNQTVPPSAAGPVLDQAAPAAQPTWPRVVGVVLAAGLLGALVWLVVRGWGRVPKEALRPDWWLLAASFALFRFAVLVSRLRWLAVLRSLGGRLSVGRAYVIGVLSQLGRYVPGKVAIVATNVYLCAREGISLRVAVMAAAYDQALLLISGGMIVTFWLGVSSQVLPAAYRWVSLGATAAGIAALHPRVVRAVVAVAGRLFRRQVAVEGLSYGTMARLGLGYIVAWGAMGLPFYLFVAAFHEMPAARVVDCTGILALALVVGLVALFAPAGIGFREGAIAALLSAYMPLPLAAAIALAFRVHLVLGELCDVVVALLLRARQRGPARALEDRRHA
ncbi:MAG TPA: lysylphosphatidylglycerol synthase domain-containing protein [Planctomycetota bacterium]|nr:lysylphosphatidylglycerol synthase domain-containing protein [Planctomycetota bacterium]